MYSKNSTYPGYLTTIAKAPIRCRGCYHDAETVFCYLQSRYYDPSIGRFINADSFASTGQGFLGYNMYAYCGNNPTNAVEIDGYFFALVGYILVQGAISGLVNFAIEYFFISGSFEESVKSFGKGFLEGAASSVFSSEKIKSIINGI